MTNRLQVTGRFFPLSAVLHQPHSPLIQILSVMVKDTAESSAALHGI